MTDLGFRHSIGKLKAFYGEKFFPPQREQMIAEKLQLLQDDDFRKICDDLIAYSNTAPTLKHFEETGKDVLRLRRQEWEARQLAELERSPVCGYCLNTGYENVWHEKDGRQYLYAYGCRNKMCLAARIKIPPSYPRRENFDEEVYE